MTWARTGSYTAHETPEYSFELDEYRDGDAHQMLFVHLHVKRWSPGMLREMLSVFAKFREAVSCPLYALNPDEDEKWEKFVGLFGFNFLRDMICENGEQRRLFLNLKSPQAALKKEKNNGQHVNEDGPNVFYD